MSFKSLCEENIFEIISEEQLFSHYLGQEIVLQKSMLSPFREDCSPSFNIYKSTFGSNKLLWKDWGIGESGNVIKLIMLLFNLNYYDALRKVNTDFNLNLGGAVLNSVGRSTYDTPTIENRIISEPTKIEITPMIWTQPHINYWSKYNISPSEAKFYNIYPTLYVSVRDKPLWHHQDNNLIFTYSFFDKDLKRILYKIYRPLEKNKQYKWLSNIHSGIIQGYEQLEGITGELLIITKSLKDCVVLRKMGLYAVSSLSETTSLKPSQVASLASRFTRLVYFYDNDEAGITNAAKQAQQYELEYIFIPDKYGVKDISDFVFTYGYKEAKELLTNLLNNGRKS